MKSLASNVSIPVNTPTEYINGEVLITNNKDLEFKEIMKLSPYDAFVLLI